MLLRIKSNYIFDKIFKYASSPDYLYKLKLFKNSKSYQKLLDIDINDYKHFYYKNQFNIFDYDDIDLRFDTNYLYQSAETDLKKLNLTVEEFKNIEKKYYENKKSKYELEIKEKKKIVYKLYNLSKVDIFSPFVDIIVPYFNNYSIYLPLYEIEKYKNDYLLFFKNIMKKPKSLYIFLDDFSQIESLKNLNIDFSEINILYYELIIKKKYSKKMNNEILFNELFSIPNIEYNLKILCIILRKENSKIKNDIFSKINDFKSLKNIEFEDLIFEKLFLIKLNNLEVVNFRNCQNISFENENTIKNIKYLTLINIDIEPENKSKIYKLNNLQEIKIIYSTINIDYSSLLNLKKLNFVDISLFDSFQNKSLLESISYGIDSINSNYTLEDEEKLIQIILKNKTLKRIELGFVHIQKDQLKKINYKNDQISDIILLADVEKFDYKNFLKKFCNIKKLYISLIGNYNYDKDKKTYIKIKNDENIIIEKLYLILETNIKFGFCFSKIKTLKFMFNLENLKHFALLENKCDYDFNSLKNLDISIYKKDILDNLCNNIRNKCKNLKKLKINLYINFKDEISYLEAIEEIICLKIYKTTISHGNGTYYSKNELKKLFGNKIVDYFVYEIRKWSL